MSPTSLLVFARCAGFAYRAPGFSHPSVPPQVRAGLALFLSFALVHSVASAAKPDGLELLAACVCELGIGAAIGFCASVLYDGAYAGGRAVDDYVGVRGSVPGAQMYAAAGFGRIWSLVFTAGFFLLGAYRLLIVVLAQSFTQIPPGTPIGAEPLYKTALALPAAIVDCGLLVAAPAIALAFVTQIALASIARVIPRFTSFTLSFPIVFAAALITTIVCVPLLASRSAQPVLPLPFLVPR